MSNSISSLKKVAIRLSYFDSILPLWIKRLFYYFPLFILKLFFQFRRVNGELWTRNSVYFNEMVLPLSDIDLTFYTLKVFTKKKIKFIQRTHQYLKLIFPYVGELACYDKKNLIVFCDFVNFYELKRDPVLMEKLYFINPELSEPRVGMDIAFILRWIESDYLQMKGAYKSRLKKIGRFMKILGRRHLSALSVEELIDELLLDSVNSVEVTKEQARFIQYYFYKNISEEVMTDDELRMLLIFFPHKWVGLPVEFRRKQINQCFLTESEKTICRAQIEWELWGLYTQGVQEQGIGDCIVHIESLKHLALNMNEELLQSGCLSLEKYNMNYWYEE